MSVDAWEAQGRYEDLGGRRIFVTDTGPRTDSAILLLHGFPSSSYDWHQVVPALAERVRVVAFDFLGYGLSEKPFDADYSLFGQADLAEAVAGRLGVERATLLAHDMGNTVAAELLMRSQEGALSFEASAAILTNGSIFIDMAQLSPGQLALLSLPDEPLPVPMPIEGFRPGLAATFSAEHPASDEDLDGIVEMVRRSEGDRLLPRLIRYIEERRANQDRWTAGLVGFAGPLSLLWGEQDPIAVVAMTERLRSMRPATGVVTWPDVAHWPSLEVPERLAAAVLERV
jgi:pimeloyl-ACP methyl ester carboxylesterase